MAAEDKFVGIALKAAKEVLGENLDIHRGRPLLYNIAVDNRLALTVNPRNPVRGNAAFQTDLCVFERKDDEIEIPRVVIEFKTAITTHDVLTYSTKAGKHKQVYPYLRYGLLISKAKSIPNRVYTHNEFLDFVVCAGGVRNNQLHHLFENLLRKEIEVSRTLEEIYYGTTSAYLFRRGVEVDNELGMVR